MEILARPIVELGKCLCVPLIKDHCGYIYCYAKNVKKLEDEVKSLQKRMEYMNEKLEEESRLNKTPLQEVKDWKESADKAVKEAEILSGQMKEEQRCLMGWCPNLRWRHGIGKKASEQVDRVQQLNEKGDGFGTIIARQRSPPDVEKFRSGNKFVVTAVMEQVMDALRDDNVRSIGIYGMGGIGKTTLVKNINNKLNGSGRFDKVIFVTVSQNQNMKVIQDQIAERLGMERDDKDRTTTGISNSRANRLLEELRKLKSVLIILDDVWKELDVVKLGLPSKEEHERCKIVVTTRNKQVCDQMGMEKQFEVKPLSDKDAWVLFESKVGDVSKNQKLVEVGEGIVKECGGCPLAIVTLGSTLAQEKDVDTWRYARNTLKGKERTQLDGIISDVIPCVEFSYDYLKDKDMKFCFLFCSLFPEDYNISLGDLRIFGIGERFLGVNARVQLKAYINRLKNCSLLLEGRTKNHVKMHDVVRLTAQYIASKEGRGFIEKTRLGLTHWPRLDNEEECKRLSLIENYDIKELPESSNFPQLCTLLLRECNGIKDIPNNFFVGMDALVNLDLSETIFLNRWPKSVSLLTNLRSLLLGYSRRLSTTSFDIDLDKLKKLEVLIINGKVKIPVDQLAELSNLKILSLKGVHLELIPANVISRLHNLEELYLNMEEIFDKKEGGCKGTDEIRSAASIVEVAALAKLTVLELRVREEEVLLMPNNGWAHELQEFKIVFGNNDLELVSQLPESGNTLILGKLPEVVPEWVIYLIQKVERLELIDWRPDLKKVLYSDTVTTQKQMKISNCSTILHIVSTTEEVAPLSINVFGRLEKLQLVGLSNLENIICQRLTQYLNITESFAMNLRVLMVTHCCKLVTLLPPNLLQALPLLKILVVKDCEAMRHIFGTSTTYQGSNCSNANNYDLETKNCLEHLVSVLLLNMPNLVRICDWPVPDGFLKNLKYLTLVNMPNLVRICDEPVLNGFLKNLEVLHLEYIPNLVRICDGPVPDEFLKNLKRLTLANMPNLVRICDGPIPDGFLMNLKEVIVRNCEKLALDVFSQHLVHCTEKIESIRLEEFYSLDAKDDLQYFNFPSLRRFYIIEIEKMETLISLRLGQPVSSPLFQNLTHLCIQRCPTLQSICSFDSKSSTGSTSTITYSIFPKLESLYLLNLEKLDSIIWTSSNPLNIGSSNFQNLSHLHVEGCNSLRCLFSPFLAKHLPCLESLRVTSCKGLEKLILISDGEEDIKDVLPQLRSLWLRYLPKLTSVFSVKTIFLQSPSLEYIEVFGCSKLKHLSLGPNSRPLLKEIRGTQEWLQALEENMTMETKSRFIFQEDASITWH